MSARSDALKAALADIEGQLSAGAHLALLASVLTLDALDGLAQAVAELHATAKKAQR